MSARGTFLLHGLGIAVDAASPPWLAAVDEILGAYRHPDLEHPELILELGGGPAPAPEGLRERGRFGDLVFFSDDGRRVAVDVHGRGWVEVEPAAGRARARLDLDPAEDAWVVAHHAFYPALLELLKFRGLFPLHAGLVARGDEGLVVCGASGSGKTTLCLALAGRGWRLLADDTCFLRRDREGVEGLAFWEDLHVTDETIRRFPSLDFLRRQAPRRANWKKHFGVEQLEGLELARRCRPRWILFPRVAGGGTSLAGPMGGAEAVLRLAPQSVVPAQPDLVAPHMGILAAVARQGRALEFSMGEDLDEVVDRLEAALEEDA